MGTTRTALAEYLTVRQPRSVRTRLTEDETFRAQLGLRSPVILTISGVATFDQSNLFAAIRRALATKNEQTVADTKGRLALLGIDQDCVVVKSAAGEYPTFEAHLKALMVLSPHDEERKKHLNALLDYFGPTAPDLSELRAVSKQRELSDDEVSTLISETINGVIPIQSRTSAAMEGKATLDDLVPNALGYFERFCGSDPADAEPDAYLGVILPAYRMELIRRDLERGLDICLYGALSGDLVPGAWTQQVSDDDLWKAMTACDPERDPYSLLGALDIALGRQHDERYRVFADEAVGKLLSEEFRRPDGIDSYELIPVLAELVLNRINTLEERALRAPYWKRMCAWMQAAFLSRLTLPRKVNLEELREWANANMTVAGKYRMILDLRREPMYRAAEMSADSFREEVLSRLVLLQLRQVAAGHPMPRSSEVDQAVSRLAAQGSPLGATLPGPLEGHKRPAEAEGRRLPEDIARGLRETFAPARSEWNWANLSYLSQYFVFDEEFLAAAREAVKKCNLAEKEKAEGGGLGKLIGACLIAVVHRDIGLARAIAEKVVSYADKMNSAQEVVMGFRVLLLAGASIAKEDEWSNWLEEKITEVAVRLPRGETSKVFLEHIQELKKVVKLTLCIHARAEALASAAN
jgi:hypothetical protein